ncbi:MAG: FtsX-like permease family protein [Firmicutes bacterium]|nr:FtsX-like permease family protein [Bacillota bacterium]
MLESISFTTRIMRKRPLRSLLSILQLALGVWIVAIVLSLSLNAMYEDGAIRSLGDTLLQLQVLKEERSDNHVMTMIISNFQTEDLSRLQDESLFIDSAFIYETLWSVEIEVDGVSYQVRTAAEATAPMFSAVGMELVEGEFFTQADVEQSNPVALISQTIADQLFPGESPVGKRFSTRSFGEREFTIIGVYKPLAPALESFLREGFLIVPLGTMRSMGPIEWEPTYNSLFVQAMPGHLSDAVEEARVILADRIVEDMELRAFSLAEQQARLRESIGFMTGILGAFAFVAVAISSIGILSIMLVSVVERTRELGLRRALGASRLQIVGHVLNEAFVLSLLGSVIGLGAALLSNEYVSTKLLSTIYILGTTTMNRLNPQAMALAFILALATGQLFGLYPAIQAAQITPVDALRDH